MEEARTAIEEVKSEKQKQLEIQYNKSEEKSNNLVYNLFR